MKIQTAIGILILAFSAHAWGASFNEKCTELSSCAKAVSELTGQKYIYSEDFKIKPSATPNLELNAENAELLFTTLLNQEGLTRVPLPEKNTFQIARQRDARDSIVPIISATKSKQPELPNTWDLVTLKYKAENADAVEHIARSARSFMPANSRIIPDELGGMLLVTDSAMNAKKLYQIIRDMDVKPTAEMKRQWQEARRERRMEHKEIEVTKGKKENSQKKE